MRAQGALMAVPLVASSRHTVLSCVADDVKLCKKKKKKKKRLGHGFLFNLLVDEKMGREE